MKVLLVAGAHPNFMKIAPICRVALGMPGVDCRIVHTGQHYDCEMSQAFFNDLDWVGIASERIWQAILGHARSDLV